MQHLTLNSQLQFTCGSPFRATPLQVNEYILIILQPTSNEAKIQFYWKNILKRNVHIRSALYSFILSAIHMEYQMRTAKVAGNKLPNLCMNFTYIVEMKLHMAFRRAHIEDVSQLLRHIIDLFLRKGEHSTVQKSYIVSTPQKKFIMLI